MWTRYLCLLSLVMILNSGHGQIFQFTQYKKTPGMVNPASITTDNKIKPTILFRNQSIKATSRRSSHFNMAVPLRVRNKMPKLGLLFSLMDDRFENEKNLLHQNFSIGFSYSIWVTPKSYFMMGVLAGSNIKRYGLTDLSTGTQYIPFLGYNPTLHNGESLEILRLNYYNLNGGLQYIVKDSTKKDKLILGIAFSEFNEGVIGEYVDEIEPRSIHLYGMYKLLKIDKHEFYPEVLIQNNYTLFLANLGVTHTYTIKESKKKLTAVDFTLQYITTHQFAGIVSFLHNNYHFGISYQSKLPGGNELKYNPNTVEMSLGYLIPVKGKKKRWKKNIEDDEEGPSVLMNGNNRLNEIQKENKDSIRPQEKEILVAQVDTLPKTLSNLTDSLKTNVSKDTMIQENPLEDQKSGRVLAERGNSAIRFKVNSQEIDSASLVHLETIAKKLKENTDLKLMLIGHTDDSGSEQDNLILSIARAKTVRGYLLKMNVDPRQMITKGMGEKKPLLPNINEEFKAQNRRVEFILFK